MRAYKIVFLLVSLLLARCAPAPLSPTPRPTRAPVAPELALQFSLDALHTDSPTGYLIGTPSVLRGSVMSLDSAYLLVNGKPLDNSSPLVRDRDKLVWLVISRGKWLLHIPGGHGDPRQRTPTVMSKDITVPDLWNAILFDAVTGEVYDTGGIVETQRSAVETLPALPTPAYTP